MPVVPLVVATLTKGLVYSLSSSVQVEGLENLLEALRKGKGVLTGGIDILHYVSYS